MTQVVLSEKDADMVRRTASNRVPDPNVDLYADHVPWFRLAAMMVDWNFFVTYYPTARTLWRRPFALSLSPRNLSFPPSARNRRLELNNVFFLYHSKSYTGGKDGARNQDGLDETAPCKEI